MEVTKSNLQINYFNFVQIKRLKLKTSIVVQPPHVDGSSSFVFPLEKVCDLVFQRFTLFFKDCFGFGDGLGFFHLVFGVRLGADHLLSFSQRSSRRTSLVAVVTG